MTKNLKTMYTHLIPVLTTHTRRKHKQEVERPLARYEGEFHIQIPYLVEMSREGIKRLGFRCVLVYASSRTYGQNTSYLLPIAATFDDVQRTDASVSCVPHAKNRFRNVHMHFFVSVLN